jgi:hypothetical protein
MLAAEKRKTNIGVGLGLALLIGAQIMEGPDGQVVIFVGIRNLSSLTPITGVMVIAGMALFIWGCFMYAQGKGYSPWVGLFGLLSIVGLLILVLMPDRHPEAKGSAPSASDPRPTG